MKKAKALSQYVDKELVGKGKYSQNTCKRSFFYKIKSCVN